MSSVSEFIGFIVISIFPSQSQKEAQIRQPFYSHKSIGTLVVNDEESSDETGSEDDTVSLPSSSRARVAPSVHHVKPVEPAQKPALTNPDFWMIAVVMSMRMTLRFTF